jgi:hypothetical protein
VLVLSSLMLVLGQSTILSGAELLGAGLLAWIWLIALAAAAFRRLDPRYRTTWILRIMLSQFATLLIIAGVVTLPQGTANLYWLVPGVIFCFAVAFFDAWVLLIETNP